MAVEMDFLRLQARLGQSHLHALGKRASRPLLEELALAGGERLLEIGCGTGGTMVYLAARRRVRILGIDRMAEMLKMARRRLRLCALSDRCRVARVNAGALPLRDRSFDRVYAESVLGFQEESAAMRILDEARRVIRPGGIFVLNETLWLPGVAAELKRQLHDRMIRLAGTPPACRRDWDVEAWRRAAESHGWSVERFERIPERAGDRPTVRDWLSELFTACWWLRGRLDRSLREPYARLSSLSIEDEFAGPLMGGYLAVLKPGRPA